MDTAAKIILFLDTQDAKNIGWAYRLFSRDGNEIESGEIGEVNGTEAEAVAEAEAQFPGAEIIVK